MFLQFEDKFYGLISHRILQFLLEILSKSQREQKIPWPDQSEYAGRLYNMKSNV